VKLNGKKRRKGKVIRETNKQCNPERESEKSKMRLVMEAKVLYR